MKFIHTADWQIGKPFARIRDDHKRALVRDARIKAIERIGVCARNAAAEFVVVAGDLFDSPSSDKSTVSAACSAIGKIGVPVYVIPGNHDHGGPGSVWTQDFFLRERNALAPNLHILLAAEPVEVDSAVLLPCPLLRRSAISDPTEWLRNGDLIATLAQDKPRIVIAHGSTQSFTSRWEDDEEDGTSGNLLDLSRLALAEIDYIALGDWHGTRQVMDKAWFSGTPELDRFIKGENHDPGKVLIVEAGRGTSPKVMIQQTAALTWSEMSFDFADDSALNEFESRLNACVGQRANEDLLRLHLRGSIGIEAATRLDHILESLDARLLRVKLINEVRVAPSQGEIDALTRRLTDPLIASVATALVDQSRGQDEDAEIARIALRELHAACCEEVEA